MPDAETRYQRVGREQRERQAARELLKRKRRGSSRRTHGRHWLSGPGGPTPRDPDGYDRDDLGLSPDF